MKMGTHEGQEIFVWGQGWRFTLTAPLRLLARSMGEELLLILWQLLLQLELWVRGLAGEHLEEKLLTELTARCPSWSCS